ncbi:hypothetical protein SERLA73DRAFT_75232 [Serpula lacrymans var. lacrymans S7.3]|uniref:NAD-P-binding protein n=2 Tax=Serpula lacrymans var. lacrymans TaxID=341189 RepID=F8Q306_SERL3|nr:uncharacterized protein SERLADRAFT_439903 [Serpula lacrymans var. lacrymans S7.9]EGN97567.1 hypothetical protein SERLA73DRAFT_75232 [Serpula lacrymans var. lacrymans S7.3]EGO23163.1 hypothetical protein SERLADRAFT_439903 [Serpula lacrymans var. lacrymans S7.9]
MSSARPLFVVAGVGNGSGTGAATARLFAKQGYRVALISRGVDSLNKLASEINTAGGEAAAFPIKDYSAAEIKSAFTSLKAHFQNAPLRVALFNASFGVWKPFLEITEEEVQLSTETNIIASFAFARESLSIITKQDVELESEGGVAGGIRKKGTLLFTGATASIRGNVTTSAFAAGKFGVRALSQSLAKEFGKQNIHVAHTIIDGGILTDKSRSFRNDPNWEANPDVRLSAEGIANSYLYLVKQDSSAWSWELDLRPAHEKW